jgi:hypothetical protein
MWQYVSITAVSYDPHEKCHPTRAHHLPNAGLSAPKRDPRAQHLATGPSQVPHACANSSIRKERVAYSCAWPMKRRLDLRVTRSEGSMLLESGSWD